MNNIRIIVIVHVFPALSETFVLDQVMALIDMGHSVRIIAGSRREDGMMHEDVVRYGLIEKTSYLAAGSSRLEKVRTALQLARRYRQSFVTSLLGFRRAGRQSGEAGSHSEIANLMLALSEADKPDVLLCHFGPNGSVAARALQGLGWDVPLVTFFHGYDISKMVQERGTHLYDHLFERGTLFMPASERFAERLRQMGCPPDRIVVQRMCVDPALLDEVSGSLPTGGGRDKAFTLVCVGRLVAKKGIATALRAFARAFAQVPGGSVRLVIIGEGELRQELEAIIAGAGLDDRVALLGALPRTDVLQIMATAQIVVQASLTAPDGDMEAMTVAVSEAMALRKPVIATRHGGIPELVQDGVTGILVDEGDEAALAEAMNWMYANQDAARQMGEAGRERVATHFAAPAWNALLEQRLLGLLEHRGHGSADA